jgi:hypothetical protein
MLGDTMRNDPSAWNPFSASPLQAGQQQGAFQPQGGDFGSIAQQIAGRVAQQLPGLIMNVMASSPQLAQQFRQQGASAWQGGQAQNIPGQWGIGGSQQYGQQSQPQQFGQQFQPQQFGGQLQPQQYGQQFQPQQFGGQFQPQQYGQQFQPQQFGQLHPQQYGQLQSQQFGQMQPQQFGQLQPQGIDVGVVQQIAGTVAQHLPGLILNLLASSPQLSQAIRQQAASQMGIYGGGAGFNPLGAGQQSGYLQQQGSEFASMAQQIAGTVAQQLPGLVMNVLASSPHLWGSGGAGSTAIH